MKKYLAFLFILMLCMPSCLDIRYDDMVNDTVYFPKSDLQRVHVTVMSKSDFQYELWIHKGGFKQNEFNGNISIDYNYLILYNEFNNTDYQMLDEEYYSFDRSLHIAKDENETSIQVYFKTDAILGDLGYGSYYIPLLVSSETYQGDTNKDKSNVLLAVTFSQPILGIDGANKGEVLLDFSKDLVDNYELDITAMLDVDAINDLNIDYIVDENLLPNGANLLSEAFYNFDQQVILLSGERYAENYLTLNVEDMLDGRWTLPIRLTTSNTTVKMVDDSYLILTIIKGAMDGKVVFGGEYVQGDEVIIASDFINQSTIIGKLSSGLNFNQFEVYVKESDAADWLSYEFNSTTGEISIKAIEVNSTTYKENLATLVVHSKETLLDNEITIRQCMKDYGVCLNKSYWNIELVNDDKVSVRSSGPGGIKALHDNEWSPNANNKLYVEFNSDEDKVILLIDLGENVREYNNLGLMPRLEWVAQSPGKVKVELSDDMTNWTTYYDGVGFKDSDLNVENQAGQISYSNHYQGMIKWFKLGDTYVNNRYMLLTVSQSPWQNRYFSFDEIFVSNK